MTVAPGDLGSWGGENTYPKYVRLGFIDDPFDTDDPTKTYSPPLPDPAAVCVKDQAMSFLVDAKAAYDRGMWQTDSSHHARSKDVDKATIKDETTLVEAMPGKRTLRLAYFFS